MLCFPELLLYFPHASPAVLGVLVPISGFSAPPGWPESLPVHLNIGALELTDFDML